MKMKKYILSVRVIIVVVSISTSAVAQIDTSAKKDSINFFSDAAKEIKPLNLNLLDTTQRSSILDFKQQKLLLGYKPIANTYFNPFNKPSKRMPNFSNPKKLDDDILVKRSFMGQNTSNNITMKSDFSLGTFQTDSKSVKIEVRDYSLVDGDRIKVYVNQEVINSNIMLNSTSYIININLKKGYNRIDVEALNEGYSGPNTAELRVYDDKGYLISSQEWNINTGNIATLGVIKN